MFAKGAKYLPKSLMVLLVILMQASISAPAHAQASPTISSISPSQVKKAGGETVIITGTNFTGATRVYWERNGGIGRDDFASFTVDSSTQITAVTPAFTQTGRGSIGIDTPNGSYFTSGLEVLPEPTISSLSQTSGDSAGGYPIVISGSGFYDGISNPIVTGVKFNGVSATVMSVSSNSVSVIVPAGTSGAANVQVITSGGSVTSTGAFTYLPPPPTVSAVSPSSGPVSGGTTVVITGTNFSNVTQVNFVGGNFNNQPAQSFTVNSPTQITAVSPSIGGAGGTYSIEVVTASGRGSRSNAFVFAAQPQVFSISTTVGDVGGGTSVQIQGNNFIQGATVSFGGVAATSVTVNSTSSITAVTAARAAGTVDVVVTTAGGSATLAGAYTYAVVPPPPTITTISPSTGPATGGTLVTVTGTNFTNVQAVRFGLFGPQSLPYTVVSSTQITFTTPSVGSSTGPAYLEIQTNGGTVSSSNGFTYVAAPATPVITSVTGATGVEAGGARVFINGSNFTGTTSVTFGGVPALAFSLTGSNLISAYAPPGTGTVPIVVTNAAGSTTAATQFTYTSALAPVIVGVSNTSPAPTGGKIAVFGSNLELATSVTVAGNAAAFAVVQQSATAYRLEVAVPAGTVNTSVPLVVTTPNGAASINLTYLATSPSAPTISSVNPQSVSAAGGMYIAIAGTNLATTSAVSFGGVAAPTFYLTGSNQLNVKVPAGSVGAVDVTVTTAAGTATRLAGLTYVAAAAPVVTSATPTFGPASGGTSVVLRGTGLTGATAVTLSGAPAASFTVNSDTQITLITPSNASGGPSSISITTPGGQGSFPFTYSLTGYPAPTVASISATSGPLAGGNTAVITGTNFVSGAVVSFGGVLARSIVNSGTQITATVPSGVAGTVDVGIATPGGAATLSSAYTYTSASPSAPTISAVSPSSGSTAGGTSVVITGTDLTGATAVNFGSTAASSFTVNSATQITAVSPAGAAGAVNVAVTTAGGTATSNGAFTYAVPQQSAPTITAVSPSSGTTAGGTSVVITGTNFTGATAVNFGTTAATSFTVNSATQITALAPAGSAGAVNVAVTTVGGTATSNGAFTYAAPQQSAPTGVQATFTTGAIAEYSGPNANQNSNSRSFGTLAITRIVMSQSGSTWGGSQGNDLSVGLKIYFSNNTTYTINDAVLNWQKNASGGGVDYFGVTTASVAPDASDGYVRSSQSLSKTYILVLPSRTATAGFGSLITSDNTDGSANFSPADVFAALQADFPANSAPSFTSTNATGSNNAPSYSFNYAENSVSGATLGTVSATDPENNPLTFSIVAGNGSGWYAINASTGAITLTATGVASLANDFEAAPNAQTLTVTVSDGTNTTPIEVKLNETNVDETPAIITGPSGGAGAAASAISVNEGQNAVTKVTADKPVTWMVTGGNDMQKFQIAPDGTITFAATPDFEAPVDVDTNNTYILTITAIDPAGNLSTQTITVTVLDVDDTAPLIANGATTLAIAVNENQTAVTKLTSNEPVTWSVSGGSERAKFAIAADGTITFVTAPDFERPTDADTNNTYILTVTATDAAGNVSTQTITVTVLDVDDTAPVITGPSGGAGAAASALSLNEGLTPVTTFTANETVTWSIEAGSDGASFRIDPRTGALVFVAATDFENPTDSDRNNTYVVRIKAVDAAGNASYQTLTVTVLNVDEIGRKLAEVSDKLRTSLRSYVAQSLGDMLSFNESLMRAGNDDACSAAKVKSLSGAANANQSGGKVKLDYTKLLSECGSRNQVFADFGLTYSKLAGHRNSRMFASLRYERRMDADLTLGASLLTSQSSETLTGFTNSSISDESLQLTVYGRYAISNTLRTGAFAGYGQGWYDFGLTESDGFVLDGSMSGKRQVYGWMLSGDFYIGNTVVTTDAIVSHAREKLGSAALAARYLGESRSGIAFAVGSVDTTRISVPLTAPIQLTGNDELGKSARLLLSPGLLCEDNDVQLSSLRCGYQMGAKLVANDGGRNRFYADYRWESVAGMRRSLLGLGYAYRFGDKGLELALEANRGLTGMSGQDNRALISLRLAQ